MVVTKKKILLRIDVCGNAANLEEKTSITNLTRASVSYIYLLQHRIHRCKIAFLIFRNSTTKSEIYKSQVEVKTRKPVVYISGRENLAPKLAIFIK